MSTAYQAPLAAQRLAIDQACRATGLGAQPAVAETLRDVADAVLEGAARFAGEVLSPLNPIGDRSASRHDAGRVITPPGFPDAYRRFWSDGWTSLGAPPEYGGQGLPLVVSAAATEMWAGANLSFAMCPEVAVGAIEALRVHGSPALRGAWLPHLVRGDWTASMCLTEPQAGSDLSTLRTRAEPDGDTWRLFGRKIYISWGDHDLADNIVHLVLARARGAPEGTRGLSLFLVPKRLPDPAGGGPANDVDVLSLEHKMGIRASPTCALALGERVGARGWLVGELNSGLACMFTMMNHMRLGVGLHSLGLAERALQLAREHAHTRRQGRTAAGADRPIIEHADVRRMLLTMKALVHAARGLCYTAAASIDLAHGAADGAARSRAANAAGLLTPLVKAWCSDLAVEVASLGVQIHGGMGYIDDCEASQIYRDARIGPIFEGTNYIQAQDLLGRKVLRDRGATLEALIADIERSADTLPLGEHGLGMLRTQLARGCLGLRRATRILIDRDGDDPNLLGAIGHHFLQWLGTLAGGWQWALTAAAALPGAARDPQARALVDTASFYAAHVLPRAGMHEAIVNRGAGPVTDAALAEL